MAAWPAEGLTSPVYCRTLLALSLLLAASPAPSQPVESGRTFRKPDLVELARVDSTITLDIRYASANNFMRRPMYTEARAFLQREAARALVRVNRKLHALGYRIVVFDAYRPWSVTKQFWDATPPAKRIFVANPKYGSKHNRGCAVDLSMIDLRTGREVTMPSGYDDFTKKAAAAFPGGTAEERRLRDLLRSTMESEGFKVDPDEWWHFDYRNWRRYRVLNIPFEDLDARAGGLSPEDHQHLH